MRPARTAAILAALSIAAGCSATKKKTSLGCESPDGCAAILSQIETGQKHVELIPDGYGGAYAALLGSGDSPVCITGQICHGEIWRLSPEGGVYWKRVESKSIDSPQLVSGGVAWRTGDGAIHAARAGDGSIQWSAEFSDPALEFAPIDGSVWVAAAGNVARLDSSGSPAWSKPFAASNPVRPVRLPAIPALPGSAAVVAGYVAINSTAQGLEYRGFNADDGATGFDVTVLANVSPAELVPGLPFGGFLLGGDNLTLVNVAGDEIWSTSSVEGWRFVQRIGDGFVAAGPFQSRLTRLRDDGTALWSIPAPAPVVWLAAAPNGTLLVGRNDGTLDSLNGQTGLTLWEYGGIAGVLAPTPPLFSSQSTIVFAGANVGAGSDTHLTTATLAGQQLERWDAGSRVVSFVLTANDDVWLATESGRLYLRRGASL